MIAAAAAAPAAGGATTITVQPGSGGRAIPSGFVGLGLEYRSIPEYTGNDPRAVNPVLVQLIRNLAPGQRPIFRLGGISTDRTWWPVRGMRQPIGITYALNGHWMALMRSLTRALDARLLLGINLEANSGRIAGTEARALQSGIGSRYVAGLEIGNEPELYSGIPWYVLAPNGKKLPWYLRRDGKVIPGRPAGYNFRDFSMEFSRIRRSLPRVPLAGPATGNFSWLGNLPRFLSSNPGVRFATFHRYGVNGCVKDPRSPHYPTVPHLLSTIASRGLMQGVGKYIAVAHHHHAAFMIDEMNSVTCNGRAGVSNSFASALWAVDTLFEMAKDGVDGVQVHTFQQSLNGLFDFRQTRGGRWSGTAHPIYYGLALFAQAAPAGSRLLRLGGANGRTLHAWATLGSDGRIRIALINDSTRGASTVTLRVPARFGQAAVSALRARSAYATGGVTLGGQSFGASSGVLSGRSTTTTMSSSGGRYTVRLGAASAALVTLSSSAGTPGAK